ncbi:CD225/dispanin family protein [Promicromonospora sp. MS192]|uniref:CD225/dispanin family protein n=1 Tax=Promicromonospora sp. MS192 TaxID=3412684 RepID=UPI003C2D1EA9
MTASPPPADVTPGTLQVPVHRGWIVASMVFFWPLAIPAVLAANRAARALGAGDGTTAEAEADTARGLARVGVLVGAVAAALGLATYVTLAVLGVRYGPELLGLADAPTATAAPDSYRTAAAPVREAIKVEPLELQTGDCFMAPDWDSEWAMIDVIPCSRAHDGLVIDVTEHLYDEFPGTTAIEDDVWYECWPRYEDYTGMPTASDSPVWTFQPDAEDWRAGGRTSVCFVEALYPVEGELSAHPQVLVKGATS